jgi:heme oxygenase
MTTTAADSIMLHLREATADLHSSAEKSAFQQMLVSGRVSREHYARFLAQMMHVHRALDGALRTARSRGDRAAASINAVVRDVQFQEPYLAEDLAFLGVTVPAEPSRATREIVSSIEDAARRDPVSLLGFHYVLEGANNGNRFIAKPVARMLGVAPGQPGTRYLDPYGEAQRELWSRFKADMDSVTFDATERDSITRAALAMFHAVERVGAEVIEGSSAAAPATAAPLAPAH